MSVWTSSPRSCGWTIGPPKRPTAEHFPFDVLPELADVLRRQRLYTDAFEAMSGEKIRGCSTGRADPFATTNSRGAPPCRMAGLNGHFSHDFRRSPMRTWSGQESPRQPSHRSDGALEGGPLQLAGFDPTARIMVPGGTGVFRRSAYRGFVADR